MLMCCVVQVLFWSELCEFRSYLDRQEHGEGLVGLVIGSLCPKALVWYYCLPGDVIFWLKPLLLDWEEHVKCDVLLSHSLKALVLAAFLLVLACLE